MERNARIACQARAEAPFEVLNFQIEDRRRATRRQPPQEAAGRTAGREADFHVKRFDVRLREVLELDPIVTRPGNSRAAARRPRRAATDNTPQKRERTGGASRSSSIWTEKLAITKHQPCRCRPRASPAGRLRPGDPSRRRGYCETESRKRVHEEDSGRREHRRMLRGGARRPDQEIRLRRTRATRAGPSPRRGLCGHPRDRSRAGGRR